MQQSSEMDPAKRRAIVQQIEKLLIADMPLVPTDKWQNATAWWPYVKGFVARADGPTYMSFETT